MAEKPSFHPTDEEFDLEIKSSKELEEAKKAADVSTVEEVREIKLLQELKRKEEARREKISKNLDELPIEEIIQSYPKLAEQFEAIPLKIYGHNVSLVREREKPSFAILVRSTSKERGGTQGKLFLDIPEPRLSEKQLRLEFRAVCACCGPETYGLSSPFRKNYPRFPDYSDEKGRKTRQEETYYREQREWEKSEEGEKDKRWHEEQKEKFREDLLNACQQNGIKEIVMRRIEAIGYLAGVKLLEVVNQSSRGALEIKQ